MIVSAERSCGCLYNLDYGVCGLLLVAVQSLYEDSWTRVKVGGRESSRFQVNSGIRQGCPLSPWLFNIFMDRIVTETRNLLIWQCTVIHGEVGDGIVCR